MFFRLLTISFLCFSSLVNAANPSLNTAEQTLYDLVNTYRQQNGLPSIPISPALTQVARTHVADLNQNTPTGSCNLHSWSNQGNWSGCCYTGNDTAQCMWNKPREISSYQGTGYENAYMTTAKVTPENALSAWQQSTGHNEVILNLGIWENISWKAIGVALENNHAVLWFGEESDNSQFDNNSATNTTTTSNTIATTDNNTAQCAMPFLNPDFSIHLPSVFFANTVYGFDLNYIGNSAFKLNPNTVTIQPQAPSICDAQLSNAGRLSISEIELFTGDKVDNIILNWVPQFPNSSAEDIIFVLDY